MSALASLCGDILIKMAPWLLFGFLAAGLLSLFFTPEFVNRHLGRRAGLRAIGLAVLLGVPLPLCSCGVLPVAVGLRKGGAGKGATAAFLLSTPQTGLDSFFATGSLLGGVFALTRPLIATLTGLVGGVAVDRLDREAALPLPVNAAGSKAARFTPGRLLEAVRYGFGTLLGDVAPALALGLLISVLIQAFVPPTVFSESALGNDWIAFPVMLLVGMPMYVCSTASIPVALALMSKGLSPGAALVFLVVGPALNGASLATLLQLFGKRCMAVYLAVIAAGAVLGGVALNLIQRLWGILPDYADASCAGCHAEQEIWQVACAWLLAILLVWHLAVRPLAARLWRPRAASAGVRRLTVRGMHCDHCRGSVRALLERYPGVEKVVQASPEAFDVTGDLPETVAADIADLGFELVEDACDHR